MNFRHFRRWKRELRRSRISFSSEAAAIRFGVAVVLAFGTVALVAAGASGASARDVKNGQASHSVSRQSGTFAAPVNTALPKISGSAQVGRTLTASRGKWSGRRPIRYAFQWQRCDAAGASCGPVAGATASHYKVTTADVGRTVRIRVSASSKWHKRAVRLRVDRSASGNSRKTARKSTGLSTGLRLSVGSRPGRKGGKGAVSSAHSGVVPSPPLNTALPTISGNAQVDQTLTVTSGSWSGSQPITLSYQWQRCDSTGANCGPISAATATSYQLTSTDTGSTVRARVTATNSVGSSSVSSAPSAAVQTSTPTSAPAGTGGNSRFGFSWGATYLNSLSDADLAHEFDMMQAAGAHWIRIDINWCVIQYNGPSSYNWAPFDRVVQAARQRGLDVLADIAYTPPWATSAGLGSHTPPDNISDYAVFAAAAAARYSAMGVHAYEIWNEPNIVGFWKPKPDPAVYTQLLKAAYTAIKGVDPRATVVSGGLSPAADDGTNQKPPTFLTNMYANGAHGYFDALGHHPYSWPEIPGEVHDWSAWYQMYGTSPSLRSLMVANGDGSKQIWATEFGAPTNGPAGSFVSEATQATILTQGFDLWKGYTWSGPMLWYTAQDYGTDTSTRENFFGVWRTDFSQKPSFAAYQTAASS